MEKEDQTTQMIGAVLVGAAIGGILGVLFAPDKGIETRKKVFGGLKSLSMRNENEAKNGVEEESSSIVGQN